MPLTRRLTMAQALVEFMVQQYTSLDGAELPFFGGCFAIFGHGNVAGLGQALLQAKDRLRVYLPRNEQAMVHTAVAFRQDDQPAAGARLHELDRAGRDEHGDRRGAGHDQPPAGVAAAG